MGAGEAAVCGRRSLMGRNAMFVRGSVADERWQVIGGRRCRGGRWSLLLPAVRAAASMESVVRYRWGLRVIVQREFHMPATPAMLCVVAAEAICMLGDMERLRWQAAGRMAFAVQAVEGMFV